MDGRDVQYRYRGRRRGERARPHVYAGALRQGGGGAVYRPHLCRRVCLHLRLRRQRRRGVHGYRNAQPQRAGRRQKAAPRRRQRRAGVHHQPRPVRHQRLRGRRHRLYRQAPGVAELFAQAQKDPPHLRPQAGGERAVRYAGRPGRARAGRDLLRRKRQALRHLPHGAGEFPRAHVDGGGGSGVQRLQLRPLFHFLPRQPRPRHPYPP